MNVLTRYLVKEIIKGSLIALILLLTLFNLFTLTDELKDLGKGNYDLKAVFYYLTLTSPRVLYELVPSSALLGSLFVLGAMGNNRELVAMRAAGLSILGILKAVFIAGFILVCFSIVIGEMIAPPAEKQAQLLKSTTQNQQISLNTRYGLWLREGDKFINVRHFSDDGKLADISIYDFDTQRHLVSFTHAENATFIENQQWQLTQLQRSLISTEKIHIEQEDKQIWQSTIAPDLLKIVVVDPDNLSLFDLNSYIDFLNENHQKSQQFELAFWGRIVNPFVTFVMLLMATPFVITVKRGMNVGSRMMIGVILGMSFNIIDKIVGHLGIIYDLNSLMIAVLPSLIMLMIGFYSIRKII